MTSDSILTNDPSDGSTVMPDTSARPAVTPSRRAVVAAAWSGPVVAAVAATPAYAASGAFQTIVTSIEYTNFQSASARDEQINVNRPLSVTIIGQIAQNALITLTVDETMVRSGGPSSQDKSTPLRMSAADGPNFSVVSSTANADGSQTLVLIANRDLVAGSYSKTISWIPLEGLTVTQVQDQMLTWALGTYTARIYVTIGTVSGSDQAYTLNRTPVGGTPD
jgi:hypothetical protein